MASCNFTQNIFGTECIGDSLAKINANFSTLDWAACQLSAREFHMDVNIRSGDGLVVREDDNPEADEQNFTINVDNSIRHIRPKECFIPAAITAGVRTSTAVYKGNIPLEDGTVIEAIEFPNPSNVPRGTTKSEFGPIISFETIALGNYAPAVTLFWRSSANANTTLYNTNYNENGSIKLNGAVRTVLFDGDPNVDPTLFVGGQFTLGNRSAKIAASPYYDTQYRFRFAAINLSVTPVVSAAAFGAKGSLTVIPSKQPGAELLNSSLNITTQRYRGFNNTITVMKHMEFNGRKFLCIGGAFTGGGFTGLLAETRGLILLDQTGIDGVIQPYYNIYEFALNGTVTDLMVVGQHLYVCGNFSRGKASRALETLVIPTMFRINLANLTQDPDNWIDRTFVNNIKASFLITPGGSTYSANPTYNIQCMAHYGGFLYAGGAHYVGSGAKRTNYGLTVHDLETGKRVLSHVCNFYSPWGVRVYSLKVETICDDIDPTKVEQTVLYVGGLINYVNTKEWRFSGNNPTHQTRVGLVGFRLATATSSYAFAPVLLDWAVRVWDGYIYTFHTESNASNAPLYIGGSFRTVNIKSKPFLAAISKPVLGIADVGTALNWNCPVNSVVYTITSVPSGCQCNNTDTGGISLSSKPSLLIGGAFTTVLGKAKPYLARVSGYHQQIETVSPSAVVWKLAAQSIDPGGSMSIHLDNTVTLYVSSVNPEDCINITKFPPLTEGFEHLNRGEMCRFYLVRDDTDMPEGLSDTYMRPVHLVAAVVDFNTKNADLLNTDVVTLTSANTTTVG